MDFFWLFSKPKKKKACLVVGSVYKEINKTIYNKYGVSLGKPLYYDYSLEIANVGVHFHCLTLLTEKEFGIMLSEFIVDYPADRYEQDILFVVTRKPFISRTLKNNIPDASKVLVCYSSKDILLNCVTTLEDLADEYFLKDDDIVCDKSDNQNEVTSETLPLIENKFGHISCMMKKLNLGENN